MWCNLPIYFFTGVSIAFAIAEQLLASSAYTLFVTHYPQLTSLSTMYSNVKNVHLRTSLDMSTSLPLPLPHHGKNSNSSNLRNSTTSNNVPQPNQKLKFLYQVTGGPCDMKSGWVFYLILFNLTALVCKNKKCSLYFFSCNLLLLMYT